MHLHLDTLRLIGQDAKLTDRFVEALHQHLVDSCPRCRVEWEAHAGDEAGGSLWSDPAGTASGASRRPLPTRPDLYTLALLEERKAELADKREIRRREAKDLRKLLDQPADERPAMIERSRTRYQSRILAELLLQHCREVLADDPEEAARIASLVAPVVDRIPGGGEPWRDDLRHLAEAHQAAARSLAEPSTPAGDGITALDDGWMEATEAGPPWARRELASLRAAAEATAAD